MILPSLVMWSSSLSLLVSVSSLLLLCCDVSAQTLSFTPITRGASWLPRRSAGLEMTGSQVTVGSRTYPAGSMVLWGGVDSDSYELKRRLGVV